MGIGLYFRFRVRLVLFRVFRVGKGSRHVDLSGLGCGSYRSRRDGCSNKRDVQNVSPAQATTTQQDGLTVGVTPAPSTQTTSTARRQAVPSLPQPQQAPDCANLWD